MRYLVINLRRNVKILNGEKFKISQIRFEQVEKLTMFLAKKTQYHKSINSSCYFIDLTQSQ